MDWGAFLTNQLPILLVVIVGVPAVIAGYIMAGEALVRRLPDSIRPSVRPWLWVGPALFFVTAFLILPAFGTAKASLESSRGEFVGLQNFANQLGDFPPGGRGSRSATTCTGWSSIRWERWCSAFSWRSCSTASATRRW